MTGVPRHSREAIVRAALAVADREGLERSSMRRVAEELGVGTMTLYSYFAGKDELLDAAVEDVAASVPLPPDDGPWQSRLRALVQEIHRSLVEHPSGVELRLKRPILGRAALRTTEAGLQILREAGFDDAGATRAWRSLFVYVFGSAAFNPSRVEGGRLDEWRQLLEALPPEEFPSLSAGASQAVATMSGEEQFVYGLDRLLAGLEAEVKRGKREAGPG
jgi:AcrR family transcriptional regulator